MRIRGSSGQPYQEEVAFKLNLNTEKKQRKLLIKLVPVLDVATS
jgi:hypothetical protein